MASHKQKILFVCDIDGTLLGADGVWPARQLDALAASVRAAGFEAEFCIATGRSPGDCERLLRDGPDCMADGWAVCFDGAIAMRLSGGKVAEVLSEALMDRPLVVPAFKILEEAVDPRGDFLVFGGTQSDNQVLVYAQDGPSRFQALARAVGDDRPIKLVKSMVTLKKMANKMRVRAISWFGEQRLLPHERADAVERARQSYGCLMYPEVRLRNGGKAQAWFELVPSTVSKMGPISSVITGNRSPIIIGMGNGANDVSFLNIANIQFCPEDSERSVLDLNPHVISAPGGPDFVAQIWPILETTLSTLTRPAHKTGGRRT